MPSEAVAGPSDLPVSTRLAVSAVRLRTGATDGPNAESERSWTFRYDNAGFP